MHFWLSQSLDIPNSTVCTSLLEFLMSCFYSQCLRVLQEPDFHRSFRKPQNFRGWVSFLFCCLNLKARLVCAQSLKKSSGISKIIFKKFEYQDFFPVFRHFLHKTFLFFILGPPLEWFVLGDFLIRFFRRIDVTASESVCKSNLDQGINTQIWQFSIRITGGARNICIQLGYRYRQPILG